MSENVFIILVITAMLWSGIGAGVAFEIMWKGVYNWKSILFIILSGPFGWMMGLSALMPIIMDKIHKWIAIKKRRK